MADIDPKALLVKVRSADQQCQCHLGDVQNASSGTSVVAQWLRTRLPMQGAWV